MTKKQKKTNDILCESIVKVFFLMNKYFDEHYLKQNTLMQQFIAFNDFNSDGRLLSFVFKHCIPEASTT